MMGNYSETGKVSHSIGRYHDYLAKAGNIGSLEKNVGFMSGPPTFNYLKITSGSGYSFKYTHTPHSIFHLTLPQALPV